MSGRQVYISEQHHKKLKVASAVEDRDMGDIVEGFIDEMDIEGWEELAEEMAV